MAQDHVSAPVRLVPGLIAVALMFVLWAGPAYATSIIIPGSDAATEGNSFKGYPFSISFRNFF
jgi:hypothetical protein